MKNLQINYKRFKAIAVIMLSIFMCSCTNENKQADVISGSKTDTDSKSTSAASIQQANTDTLMVDIKAAVFILPDSIQIKKSKKEMGEEDFYEGANDFIFYMNKADSFLQKQRLPIIVVEGKKIIRFIKEDKTSTLISTDTLPALWNIYLFDTKQKPIKTDITSMEDNYNHCYKCN